MNTDEKKYLNNNPIIIDADDNTSAINQTEGEVPVITIEDDDTEETASVAVVRQRHIWLWRAIAVLSVAVVCCILFAGWRCYRYYYAIGVPISVSPKENIAKLERPVNKNERATVVMTQDSILGVALNFYTLDGLRAELTTQEPDSTDTDVIFYSRSADYTNEGKYIGTMVMQGKELRSDASRLGYCGMANGNIVIGVSRSDRVKDYCEERGGSFFRQFILLSAGVVPSRFDLHGKVERRAIGRMADDHLYYIETRHKETLWDFADALREYGFVDALYITGGTCYTYYRNAEGQVVGIGDPENHPDKNHQSFVPWLVFRQR